MGHFKLDVGSKPGVLILELHGLLAVEQMAALASAHNDAVEAFRGVPYRVFCDLRAMLPLSPEAAAYFQTAKSFSALQPNFMGSAVLVASSVVAMQYRRTSVESGITESELISDDEPACWEHLRRVQRTRR